MNGDRSKWEIVGIIITTPPRRFRRGLGNGYKQGVKKYCITRIEHSELSHEKGQQLIHPK